MPLRTQGKDIQLQQNNEINAEHPKLKNGLYDAGTICTDQNPNVDVHHDPPRQTDGEFLGHGQTGPSSITPRQAPELS